MKIAPVADVKARFSKYLEECVEGPVVVTKNGRPAAVLVAVSERKKRFLALLDAAHDRIKKSGGVRHEDFWKAAGKKDRRISR